MHHTVSSVRTQKSFIRSQRAKSDCQSTFNLLTSDILFDEVEKRLPEHRERLFPPTETLAMFVTQALSADRSCQHEGKGVSTLIWLKLIEWKALLSDNL